MCTASNDSEREAEHICVRIVTNFTLPKRAYSLKKI